MSGLNFAARKWLSQIFFEIIPSFLLTLLESFYVRVLAPKKSPEGNVDVYDLIDVEKTSRFQAINGVVYHNCLGISYLMAKVALSKKLTADTGVRHTPEDAEKLINLFFEVYPDYAKWIDFTTYDYARKGHLKLLDGWVMFGDNPNFRSVSNCPIQGAGGCILRKAIQLSQDAGLKVIIPLHDALYIEYPTAHRHKPDMLAEAMHQAFTHYFDGEQKEWAGAIRQDIDIWGPDWTEGKWETLAKRSAKTQKIYIDPRGKAEYERFSQYF